MDAGEALKLVLPMAVPLWIEEFKRLPWKEVQKIATESSQFVGEHGDNILFRGPKKGDTAKAFNHLARGIAVLAFAPGGVNTMGMHFEAIHPESLEGGPGRWLYHPIFINELATVSREGLVPNEKGKVFFTGLLSEAARYAAWAFGENRFELGDPILLRVHSAHLHDVEQEHAATDDWSVERAVPAVFIQAWVPEKQAWIELREVSKQGYFNPDRPQYGTTPDDFLKYVKEQWPTV